MPLITLNQLKTNIQAIQKILGLKADKTDVEEQLGFKANVSDIEDIETTVSDIKSQKMDKNNPVGTGSFSMGRKDGSIVGNHSHAEGMNTIARGDCSHAEGNSTTASSGSSHAEGASTTASGMCSHAEGTTTTASGNWSHAEGANTTASGDCSHAQGRYNIKDVDKIYAHIVGNGAFNALSNAHTLDWAGNAWFAGDVYTSSTSGTNKDDGSKKLATEEYVDTAVAGVNAVPSATTDDNDKILMVVNGTPTWVGITNAEGVAY